MRMGGVRVRGTVPIAEDTEGVSNDPIGAACGRDAGRRIGSASPDRACRSRLRESQRRCVTQIDVADAGAAAGVQVGGSWPGDVASVPPHSLVAARRPGGNAVCRSRPPLSADREQEFGLPTVSIVSPLPHLPLSGEAPVGVQSRRGFLITPAAAFTFRYGNRLAPSWALTRVRLSKPSTDVDPSWT
jgi:hypothetical protein